METFIQHTGTVAPINQANIDTDQIIPAVYLKRIERTGYGPFLFAAARYDKNNLPDPSFLLNDPVYQKSSILVANRNFGCGSSREHAPWALLDYGFRVIIAPSFADIFQKNCYNNGLVTAMITEDEAEELLNYAKTHPGMKLRVDLETCSITCPDDSSSLSYTFVVHADPSIHAFRQTCFLTGLDDIGIILAKESKISTYEANRGTIKY